MPSRPPSPAAASTTSVCRWPPGQSLDAAVEDVVRAGGRVVQRGEHAPGLPFAYVTDPDGNMLEL
jgi:predicted enzyme related to lactoylglutathione lyase